MLATNNILVPDLYEPNDDEGSETYLPNGYQKRENLSIHSLTDVDWFKFTLSDVGTAKDFIGINFNHELGDLVLELYDAKYSPLTYSDNLFGVEYISLAGYEPGDYYFVVYGYDGATNPSYTFESILPTPPTPDAYEPNDRQSTATVLNNNRQSIADLSIHSQDDRDWFKLTLPSQGLNDHFVSINLNNYLGDLDLELYDINGNLVRDSSNFGGTEQIYLTGLPIGYYWVQVAGYSGNTNPSYQLEVNLPELNFNPAQYGASYPDLIGDFGYNLAKLTDHYFNAGIPEGRSSDRFDELSYIASNPDLISPIGLGGAAEHYLRSGYLEGRPTHQFDPSLYLASNTDLIAALAGDRSAATVHYVQDGYREGRPTGSFAPEQYLASHLDVFGAVGLNLDAAADHFVDRGWQEGRIADRFDEYRYLASYPDLIGVFSPRFSQPDGEGATEHYLNSGIAEGRKITFDPLAYMNVNSDVAAAYGFDPAQATLHYLSHGFYEGRPTGVVL
jgi:hypothetical protein